MKPYRYFKTLAKLGLAGNFIKSIVVFSFVTLLPQLLFLLPSKINFKGYEILIGMAITSLILIPCFRMGAIGFVSDALSKKKPSLGNIFDGFAYIIKLMPFIISKIIPFIPFVIMSYIAYIGISRETLDILTEYSKNPMENIDLLSAISDKEYTIMLLFELALLLSVILSVIFSSYLAFTEYIIYNEKLSGIKAILKSIKMMKGRILYYIGFNLSFIFWHLASGITMGVSTFILNPYKEASFILFYNYIRFENGEIEIKQPLNEENIEVQNEEE